MASLQPGQIVPNFTLRTADGRPVRRSDYRGNAGLLILFVPPHDALTEEYLLALDQQVAHWSREQRALVVATGPLAGLRHVVALQDPEQAVQKQFLPDDAQGGWLITDRYGELYTQGVASQTSDLPQPQEFGEWLTFVGMRCGG